MTTTTITMMMDDDDLLLEMCMGMGFPMGTGIPWEWE